MSAKTIVLAALAFIGLGFLVKPSEAATGQSSGAPEKTGPRPTADGSPAFAQALVAAARESLAQGVREKNVNSGDVIDGWLKALGINPPANWCAAAVAAWLRRAEEMTGIKRPIAGSAGAKNTMTQFQAANRWLTVAEARAHGITPGMVPVWHRGDEGAWTGHIGVVDSYKGGDTFQTIEGNSGPMADRVASMTRSLSDPKLLGFGVV